MKNKFFSVTISLLIYYSFASAQNVGIGTQSPTLARLQVNGSVGAAVAIFGADKFGVAIEADNPEVGFNYFYNNGSKTLKAGYAGLIGMNPGNGDIYLGNFNGNQSTSDLGNITGYRNALLIKQNGRIGIGVDNPTRAFIEQNGSVGVNAAIFGGEGKGVSLQRDWPSIGLNHYYSGNHLSIGGGYGAQIGVDQNTGAIYFTQFSNSASLANGLYLNPIAAINFKYGKIGVNTNDPQSEIHISHANPGFGSTNLNYGLRLDYPGAPFYFNIYGTGGSLGFASNGNFVASINATSGSYFSISDSSLKKNITRLKNRKVLEDIMLLQPVDYNMKTDLQNNKKEFGFIAQELEEIFPELVADIGNIKTVNYSGLIPILTRAIQEQQQKIVSQQKDIDDLKREINELRKLMLTKQK